MAILIIYLSIIGAVVGVGLLLIPPLVDQARALWAAFPEMLHKAQLWLMERGLLSRELTVKEAVQQTPVNTDAVGTVFSAVFAVVGGVFGLLTVLIITFYLLVDSDSIVRTFLRLFPRAEQARVHEACRRVTTKVSAWLGGQLLLAAIIGSTAALGLWLLGVPYFYVLALVAAVGEMIPVIGPLIAAIPAILVAFTVSPGGGPRRRDLLRHPAAGGEPRARPEDHGTPGRASAPSIVIIALLLGGSLLGIVGAILAVPTAAILQVLFEELVPEAAPD